MRLDKAAALFGLSRSEAKEAIRRGRVAVNGQPVFDSAFKLGPQDNVSVDGQTVDTAKHHHFMVHKPADCLTATFDPRGDRTVLDLLPENLHYRDLGPVGRLDRDVTGLVILTTDGELAHRLISPKRDIEKRYFAHVEGKLTEADGRAFESGIALKDFTAKPARLEILSANDESSDCYVYVTEGKFHQVKRMLGALGHPVIALRRECVAGLNLDETLAEGQYRALREDEIRLLYEKAGLSDE